MVTAATLTQVVYNPAVIFEGNCWKFGHNIPTDEITPTHVVWKSFSEMATHVLESLNPEFPQKVQKGDILIAGRNFGCSSGRVVRVLQAAFPQTRWYGCDPLESSINWAKRHLPATLASASTTRSAW